MQTQDLLDLVTHTLDERKAQHIKVLDVRGKTSVTDFMVIATGTSDRHVKSLIEHVESKVKEHGGDILGIEGGEGAEWILMDLGDVVVHTMTAPTREFYQLERLWEVDYAEETSRDASLLDPWPVILHKLGRTANAH